MSFELILCCFFLLLSFYSAPSTVDSNGYMYARELLNCLGDRNCLARALREGFLEEAMSEVNNTKVDEESIQEKAFQCERKS